MSFTTNAKGTSLGRKHKTRKRPTKNKPQTIKKMVIEIKKKRKKKMVIGSYILIITLNVNGLNTPTKRQRLAGGDKNMYIYVFSLTTSLYLTSPPNCM